MTNDSIDADAEDYNASTAIAVDIIASAVAEKTEQIDQADYIRDQMQKLLDAGPDHVFVAMHTWLALIVKWIGDRDPDATLGAVVMLDTTGQASVVADQDAPDELADTRILVRLACQGDGAEIAKVVSRYWNSPNAYATCDLMLSVVALAAFASDIMFRAHLARQN